MAEPTFTIEIYINTSPTRVLQFLEDLSEHDKIHPLIVSVQELVAPEAKTRRYQITDRVPIGLFKIKAIYEADIWRTADGNLQSVARQSPGIVLNNTTTATAQGDGTLLREVVSVKAPFFLREFTLRQARESHQKMFQRLKVYLEAA